jgi:uncharacterized protein YndB with AHSA1/START domain
MNQSAPVSVERVVGVPPEKVWPYLTTGEL